MAWGKTGNDANVYMTKPVYGQSSNRIPFGSLNFPLGGVNAFSAGNILGSNSLSPEMTTEFEVGLNMAFSITVFLLMQLIIIEIQISRFSHYQWIHLLVIQHRI